MKKNVFVYTMNTCPFCSEFKDILRTRGILFTERQCDEYSDEYEFLVENTGNDFIPAIEIKDKVNKTIIFLVPGRDFDDLEEAANNIEYNLN